MQIHLAVSTKVAKEGESDALVTTVMWFQEFLNPADETEM